MSSGGVTGVRRAVPVVEEESKEHWNPKAIKRKRKKRPWLSQGRAPAIPKVVSPAEWTAARKKFLAKEKEFTRLRDELSRERRELPWEKVEKPYVFEGPNGKETLAELFGGRSQLIVYHFMLGPGWNEGCPSCSFLADHFDGTAIHLAQPRRHAGWRFHAPTLTEIEAFKKRMGWRFKWVSSFGNDFNYDYHVSFTKEDVAKGEGILQLRR